MRGIIFLAALVVLSGCAAIEKAKDKKAFGRVVADAEMRKQVYEIELGRHPSFPQIIYVPGKDSIIEKPYPVDVVRDSLIKADCPSLNLDSLKRALVTKVYIQRVDTFFSDNPELRRQLDFCLQDKQLNEGRVQEKDKQIKELGKKISVKNWISVGLGVVIVGLIVLLFKRR